MSPKIAYHLEQDEDGFPPISVELLNATQLSVDTFRIANAPFFAKEVSFGDVVRAAPSSAAEQYEFVALIEGSSFTSLSIIVLDPEMDTFLMDFFRGQQCVLEYGEFGSYRVLAVAIPPYADYTEIRRQLAILEGQSKLSFAELAVPAAA